MTQKLFTLLAVVGLVLAGCVPAIYPVVVNNSASAAVPTNRQTNASAPTNNQPIAAAPASQSIANVQPSNQSAASTNDVHAASTADLTRLPIGDGHVSTQPEVGSVWSCQTNFTGGGADHIGSWAHSDGTFDLTAKPTVDGSVSWPSSFSISLQGSQRVIAGNDLPDHATGNFPISASDDAYTYDRNPNSISAQQVSLSLPANPALSTQPSCLTGGPIGILLTGSYLFNALDAAGLDAVAHEVQDNCQGHPERSGSYHYHDLTTCLAEALDAHGNSPLAGYALDGFGIFGPIENGVTLTTADLDECHGRTSEIEWDGQRVVMYHYVATADYPYTIGCFRGTSARTGGGAVGGQSPTGALPGIGGQSPSGPMLDAGGPPPRRIP